MNMLQRIILTCLLVYAGMTGYAQSDAEIVEMANDRIDRKEYASALMLIDKVIARNDSNEWLYLKKAEVESPLYGPHIAVRSVWKAIAINRRNAESYNRAGSYYTSFNSPDSALMMYNLAIRYATDDTTRNMYLVNRGTARQFARDFEGARVDLEKALLFTPNNIALLNNLAAVYSELGRHQEGITYLKRIITLEPDFIGPYVNLGFIYTAVDSLDLALGYFNKALQLKPDDALSYNNRGYVYYKKADYPAALKDINHSITLYPSNSYAFRNLALVYLATGKKSEACDALQYATKYGFKDNYGDEVDELTKKHCKKR